MAGEHADNAKLYEIVKGLFTQTLNITAVVILSVSEKAHNILFCTNWNYITFIANILSIYWLYI